MTPSASDPSPGVGAPTLVETAMVLAGRIGPTARIVLHRILDDGEVEVLPFAQEHWPLALRAFTEYGKGTASRPGSTLVTASRTQPRARPGSRSSASATTSLKPTSKSSRSRLHRMAWDVLTDEQREIRDLVRQLAHERIAPRAAEIDESHEFPWDVVELFRENDIFGLFFDEQYGGLGTGTLLSLIAIEEVAKVCGDVVAHPRGAGARLARAQARGHRGAEGSGTCRGSRAASGCRAYALTESGSGSDCGGDAHDRAPRRRRVRPRRLEALHHERRRRRTSTPSSRRPTRTRATPASRPSSSRPTRRASRSRGSSRRWASAAPRPASSSFDDVPHPGREPPRRGGRRLQDRDAHPRPLAPRRRRAGARHRAGRDRLRARVREDARDDGQADRAAPADLRRSSPTWRPSAKPRAACSTASAAWSTRAPTAPS